MCQTVSKSYHHLGYESLIPRIVLIINFLFVEGLIAGLNPKAFKEEWADVG